MKGLVDFLKIIWDRGFRFVEQVANSMGLLTHMPDILQPKQKQHPTDNANESRSVTMVRWVIEAVDGRIKNVFKIFRGKIRNNYIPKSQKLFKICCALPSSPKAA